MLSARSRAVVYLTGLVFAVCAIGCETRHDPTLDAGTACPKCPEPPDAAPARAATKIFPKCVDPKDPNWIGGAVSVFVVMPVSNRYGDAAATTTRTAFRMFCPGIAVGISCSVTEIDVDAFDSGEVHDFQVHTHEDFKLSAAVGNVVTLTDRVHHASMTIDYAAQVVRYAVDEPAEPNRAPRVKRGEGPCPFRRFWDTDVPPLFP